MEVDPFQPGSGGRAAKESADSAGKLPIHRVHLSADRWPPVDDRLKPDGSSASSFLRLRRECRARFCDLFRSREESFVAVAEASCAKSPLPGVPSRSVLKWQGEVIAPSRRAPPFAATDRLIFSHELFEALLTTRGKSLPDSLLVLESETAGRTQGLYTHRLWDELTYRMRAHRASQKNGVRVSGRGDCRFRGRANRRLKKDIHVYDL